ncbi:MAG: hypothetical protein ACI9UT_002452 [Flavobacteriales bacterium]|jgi:hypothetical protein
MFFPTHVFCSQALFSNMDISILQIQSSSVCETAYYVEILCRLKLIDEVEETDFCSLFNV